jgi:GNAT superfamily N-acetyltransferase
VLARRLAPLLGSPDDAVLVAVDAKERPIGWIHVGRTRILEADEHAVIHGLVVDEASRSGGLGAELLAAAEGWARERGIGTMLVRSRSTRERAHRFYRERGYREVKRSHVFEKRLV